MREKQWQPGFELPKFSYTLKSSVMTGFWARRDYRPIAQLNFRIAHSLVTLEREKGRFRGFFRGNHLNRKNNLNWLVAKTGFETPTSFVAASIARCEIRLRREFNIA